MMARHESVSRIIGNDARWPSRNCVSVQDTAAARAAVVSPLLRLLPRERRERQNVKRKIQPRARSDGFAMAVGRQRRTHL